MDLGHLDKPVPAGEGALSCVSTSQDRMSFGLVGDDKVVVRDVEVTNDCGVAVGLDRVEVESDHEFWLLTADDRNDDGGLALNGGVNPAWSGTALAPGQRAQLRVAFRGSAHRAHALGHLRIETRTAAASGKVDVALEANAASRCISVEVVGSLDFGCQLLGSEGSVPVLLTSCGGVPATLSDISLSGSSAFRVEGARLPVVMQPGERQSVRLVYGSGDQSAVAPAIDWDQVEMTVYGSDAAGDSSLLWRETARGFTRINTCRGLEVEVTWVTPGDPDVHDAGPEAGADLDLHFMHPNSLGWYRYPFDAFWINRSPNWGDFSSDRDDPTVGSDSVDGQAPEQVIVALPEHGSYRIGVHYWEDHGFGISDATVVVRYFGAEVFARTQRLSPLDLWDVGLVTWPGGLVLETNGGDPAAVEPGYEAPCDPAGCKGK